MTFGAGPIVLGMTLLLAGLIGEPFSGINCQADPKQEKHAKPEKKGNVKVTLAVITASYKSPKTDKKLRGIARQVGTRCKKLKGFRLKATMCRSLPVNKKSTFRLLENQLATVIIKQPADKNNRVILSVFAPKTAGITYRSTCGKFLPIVTPYHTKQGDRLILAVRVQPCNGEK